MNIVMIPRLAAREVIRKYRRLKGGIRQLSALMKDPVLSAYSFPEKARKPRWNIWLENILWLIKHGEVNYYYFLSGMDVKGSQRGYEVLPYNKFSRIRDSRNLHPKSLDYNYVGVLRDKFIFSQVLKSFNIPAPSNIALLSRDGATWLSDMSHTSLEHLVEATGLEVNGFCKRLVGTHGQGAFPLQIAGGRLYSKEEEVPLARLAEWLDGQYLLQGMITQHPKLSELHPTSVNTIRVITFNHNGKIEIFCTALRLGTKGSCTDNWTTGGIAINIDQETGKLTGTGVYRFGFGGRVTEHPDTGVKLEGFEVPFFKEGVELVCRLHSYLYGIHSVGWDFAVTPDGPVVIEGNDDWGIGIPTSLYGNFRSRVSKFYEI